MDVTLILQVHLNQVYLFLKNRNDFKEYQYFVGKDSLGIGDDLPEYVALAIKIVMQGTNSALSATNKRL